MGAVRSRRAPVIREQLAIYREDPLLRCALQFRGTRGHSGRDVKHSYLRISRCFPRKPGNTKRIYSSGHSARFTSSFDVGDGKGDPRPEEPDAPEIRPAAGHTLPRISVSPMGPGRLAARAVVVDSGTTMGTVKPTPPHRGKHASASERAAWLRARH